MSSLGLGEGPVAISMAEVRRIASIHRGPSRMPIRDTPPGSTLRIASRGLRQFGFAITAQVIGAMLSGAIFGNIARLLAKLDAADARYRAQREKIDEFVSFHELPLPLTRKLHAYCQFLFAVNRGFDIEQVACFARATIWLLHRQRVSINVVTPPCTPTDVGHPCCHSVRLGRSPSPVSPNPKPVTYLLPDVERPPR